MRTREELDQLRDQAVALRRAGKSRREIKELLAIADNKLLTGLLRGESPQEWAKRPNAKDDLRAQARELRLQGLKYKDIAARLHVSLSSVSLWVRDLPAPPRFLPEESKKRSIEGFRRYQAEQRVIRDAQRLSDITAAASEIGKLSNRELLVAGAIAYWCEGTKKKSPSSQERVVFVNSDERLIRFFLRFLAAAGVTPTDLTFCVYIHESADVEAAERYWQQVVGAAADQFTKTTLKRHNPKTNRKNTGENYHGCLRISVYRSVGLYRKIAGWASGAMAAS